MLIIRYLRQHPFSVMALCNVAGDCGYLGFAFAAQGWVSLPKLCGACFTLLAHIVLLAYGDDQAQRVAHETGMTAHLVLVLRKFSCRVLRFLPSAWRVGIQAKPVGISFGILGVNGVGLLVDALGLPFSTTAFSQIFLSLCIIIGCAGFSCADFVPKQRTADFLLKHAPRLFVLASFGYIALAVETLNPFLMLSVFVFLLSNLAGFYAKIDKKEVVSAGI